MRCCGVEGIDVVWIVLDVGLKVVGYRDSCLVVRVCGVER